MDVDVFRFAELIVLGSNKQRKKTINHMQKSLSKFSLVDESRLCLLIEKVQQRIRKDIPHYQHVLYLSGLIYARGLGTKVDFDKAFNYLDEAIALGNPYAMRLRASMYRYGKGCLTNYIAAVKLFDLAIEKDDTIAMVYRAQMHIAGEAGPINYLSAITLYEQAIAKGCRLAMQGRAVLYKNDLAGKVNLIKYRILHFLSADQSQVADRRLQENESLAFYNLVYGVPDQTVIPPTKLASALKFINTLPTSTRVTLLKNAFYKRIETEIINKYPIYDGFHRKVLGLSAYTLDDVFYLHWEYAKRYYDEEKYQDFIKTISYKNFAMSDDPHALTTLKTLALQFSSAHYWIGMSYLNHDQPSRLGLLSGRQKAIKYFKLAASASHSHCTEHELANIQLESMGLRIGTPRPDRPTNSKEKVDLLPQRFFSNKDNSIKTPKNTVDLGVSEILMVPDVAGTNQTYPPSLIFPAIPKHNLMSTASSIDCPLGNQSSIVWQAI